jgi:HK97 family phage major capsid protein
MKFENFLKEKSLTIEALKGMEAEQLAGLYNEYNEKARKEIEEATKANSTELEALKDAFNAMKDNQLKQLNAALEAQGVMLKKLSKQEPVSEKSLREQIAEKADAIKAIKENGANVKFEIKSAGDMSISGNVTGEIPQAQRIAGINFYPSRVPRLLDLVSRGSVSSNLVSWVYQANKDGTAGSTAEAAAKNQIDFDLLVGSQKVEKVTAYITVTDEMLEDVEQMASAIDTELRKELLKAIELGCYSGSGVSPALNGIKTVATAFAAGSFAAAIDNANEVDVLVVAANQIKIANQDAPNAIMMHPTDVTKLKVAKVSSNDKRYIERLSNIGGTLLMDGIQIIETTLVTAGTYLIGDFTKAMVWDKKSVTVEIGLNSDNFVKNYKTVRAEWRGVCFVKNNDRTAFVTGTFATDMAALETA